MGVAIYISRALLDAIIADAQSDPAHERCGLLTGDAGAICGFIAAANIHPEPSRQFELDPAAQIAALRAARNGGPAVIGHYHSHPTGPAQPSPADAAAAANDGRLWLIIGSGEARAWRSNAGGSHLGCFDPVDLEIVAPERLASPTAAP
jgi:desampylase